MNPYLLLFNDFHGPRVIYYPEHFPCIIWGKSPEGPFLVAIEGELKPFTLLSKEWVMPIAY